MSATDLSMRVRMSDPRPGHCSACFRGAEAGVKFVDMDSAIDRGQRVVERDGVVWEREVIDDLHLCESCVRQAAELLAFRPEVHARQRNEIARLERAVEHWRGYASDLENVLHERPEELTKLPPRQAVTR